MRDDGEDGTFAHTMVVNCMGVCANTTVVPTLRPAAKALPQVAFGGGWYTAIYLSKSGLDGKWFRHLAWRARGRPTPHRPRRA